MNNERGPRGTAGLQPAASSVSPRRVLVVSANMGGGHHATAAALAESVGRIWPNSEIRRIDALDVMGRWVGDAFRGVYVHNVEATPWLYEFFYSSLWRHRWFAAASKRFVGSWCGRRLIRHIDAFDPDLVLSTYPLGTAGLAWLIRNRALSVPVGSWVSDFAPHPFWVYPEIAVNYLVDAAAVPSAMCAEPHARYRISALPVVSRFGGPADRRASREAARRELNLRSDAVVTLISCGSYGFGDVTSLVHTVAQASDRIQVVAICGHNSEIFDAITALGYPPDRVLPFGWTTQMPALTAAADLVIGNAGGATALEAMACGVPVVLADPIAAHGAANADLMTASGAAELCSDEAALAAYLRAVVTEHTSTSDSEPVADAHGRNGIAGPPRDIEHRIAALDADVAAVGNMANRMLPHRRTSWPMRGADAFFCHIETSGNAQELGVILELGTGPDGALPTLSAIRQSIQPRSSLPSLRRILVRRGPSWRLADAVDVSEHIDEISLVGQDRTAAWGAAGDLFAQRLPAGRPAWQMRLISGWSNDRALFAIKMHHSQADGVSALGLLDRLLDPARDDPLPERHQLDDDPHTFGLARARTVARGLFALASRGFAPRHPLGDAPLTSGRELVPGSVPWAQVRTLAKQTGVGVTHTAMGIGAHVLQRVLAGTDLLAPGEPLRTMIPIATRPARLDRDFGNWTGSLAADLDMADRSLADRVVSVRDEMRRRQQHGEAEAAAAAMTLAGLLPAPLHRAFSRVVYQRRFFSSVLSFMPGARRERWLAGAPVVAMTPVLPLPPRVPLAAGMILTAGRLDFGVAFDRRLPLPREHVTDAVARALAEVSAV